MAPEGAVLLCSDWVLIEIIEWDGKYMLKLEDFRKDFWGPPLGKSTSSSVSIIQGHWASGRCLLV